VDRERPLYSRVNGRIATIASWIDSELGVRLGTGRKRNMVLRILSNIANTDATLLLSLLHDFRRRAIATRRNCDSEAEVEGSSQA
jgi:hypothetical protein